jgi:hypothetical protein
MYKRVLFIAVLTTAAFGDGSAPAVENARPALAPIALNPDNPHYFIWHGKPTILIGSGEHYGAVLNRPFDYAKYLESLGKLGLNHTRLFTGLYVEDNGTVAAGPQAGNTLDPAPGQLLCPFARSDVPGYPKRGNKFDLKRWDETYFARLKDFIRRAAQAGVVVEVNLFCPYYVDEQWRLAPLNPANNVNGLGPHNRTDVFTLDRNSGLLPIQEAMVRRIANELRNCDNIYYEICNEPYFGGVTLDWQHRIVAVIVDAEKDFAHRHLISRNVANGKSRVDKADANVAIFNFHYAWPPDTVAMNFQLDKPIGDNETGFRGTGDGPYRREAWEFMLAGGALFSNLDYSFTVGHEDGSFALPRGQWGGGSPALREQLRHLKQFLDGFDFVRLKPDEKLLRGKVAPLRPGNGKIQLSARALVEPGKQYAIYLGGTAKNAVAVEIDLPSGSYEIQWLDPRTGHREPLAKIAHSGGLHRFQSPVYDEDAALSIRRAVSSR